MAGSVDDIMTAAAMKPIFAVAKREPVAVALALTSDKNAAILVSKKLGPKKVRAQLRSEAKKLKIELDNSTSRFGTAGVEEEDAGLLLFRVNKTPGGPLAAKVRERMRKAGWSKIEFVVDETLEESPEEEGEGIEALAGAEGADAREALGAEPPPPPPPPEPAGKTAAETGQDMVAKSRLAWIAARKKIETDLDKLRTQIMDTFKEEGVSGEIDTAYRAQVAPVLGTLDDSLANALDEAVRATDAEVRAKHIAEARAIMGKYAQFLGSSQIITDLDTNPFMPMAIKATIGGTLKALAGAVR